MIRVGIDARAIGPHYPGIGRATLGLLHGLCEIEAQVEFVVVHLPDERDLVARTGVQDDARFRLVECASGPQSIDQQWHVPRLVRTARLNVWHAPYYWRPFFGLPPTVVTIADMIGPSSDRNRLPWKVAMRLSVLTARQIITHSNVVRQQLHLAYHLPSQRLHVIAHGADEQFRPQSLADIVAVRERYELPERYVMYLGSNKPHKNLSALVEAWASVIKAGNDGVILVIAGREDPRYPLARERVAQLGMTPHVRFLPDLDDAALPPMLAGALFFVFPSLDEGFGLPPLEAMACGTPVLVSDRASLPEVVGDAGVLVEPQPTALAAAMDKLLRDKEWRHDLRERGLARAAHFSWANAARETLHVYQMLAGAPSRLH